jgi:hypothetical protein
VALLRLRAFAAIALLVALTLGLGSSVVLAPRVDAQTSLTTLTLVDGQVLVRHGDGDFATAREGDVVAAGDMIRVGSGASAELTYFEGSSIRLEAEAEMVVASLETERGHVVSASHALARAWHVVGKLISANTRYDMRGPSSTASVRG